MSEEIELARQWVAKAANDLLSADNNLKAEKSPADVVCFHCQQAAEKLLKAFLVAGGHPAPAHTTCCGCWKKCCPTALRPKHCAISLRC